MRVRKTYGSSFKSRAWWGMVAVMRPPKRSRVDMAERGRRSRGGASVAVSALCWLNQVRVLLPDPSTAAFKPHAPWLTADAPQCSLHRTRMEMPAHKSLCLPPSRNQPRPICVCLCLALHCAGLTRPRPGQIPGSLPCDRRT
jgi:hypothetical protein